MKANHIKLMLALVFVGGAMFMASCMKDAANPQAGAAQKNLKLGITSAMPAYYDGNIFNIQFKPLSAQAAATQIAHNPGINNIYQSDPGLPGGLPFISVIDAIPTDGMNPVWREVQIVFNQGFTPVQFLSDNDVLAAAAGPNPMITLNPTDEVYICPVMGKP